MLNLRMLKLSDMTLWVSAALLVAIGFLAIFITTYSLPDKSGAAYLGFLQKHFFSFAAALLGMLAVAYLDYRHLKTMAPLLYALMLLLLMLVLFSGYTVYGAQRWLSVGPFSFQPSEISKFIFIIVLARFLAGRAAKINNIKELLPFIALVGPPFVMIFYQPDLGTALIFIFISVGMLVYAESSLVSLAYLFTPALSLILVRVPALWFFYVLILFILLYLFRINWFDFLLLMLVNVGVGLSFSHIWASLKAYQQQRILSFFNPAADPLGAGYHTMQSKIAIGSGFIFGKGLLSGTQTQLHFIPIQHADFIFSAIGEEFGFWGAAAVFILFALIIWRGISIAQNARDTFGSFLAIGVTLLFATHFFINIGMVMGLLPVVGIPLPFISFGGSFLFVNLLCVGLLQSIAMRRQKIIF